MDPLADKLLTSAALLSLVQMELAPAWIVWIIIGRDFAVTGLRSLAYARGIVIAASRLGKVKMVVEVVAILGLILGRVEAQSQLYVLYLIGQTALWIAVVTALASAADYFRRFNLILSPRIADITFARERRGGRRAG